MARGGLPEPPPKLNPKTPPDINLLRAKNGLDNGVHHKQHSPQFKARVAIEAIRGEKTLSQLGSQFKLHPIQIAKWRRLALEQMPELFVDGRTRKTPNADADSDALYQEIGRLKVELDWLKKKVGVLD